MRKISNRFGVVAFVGASLLAACGGGGGSSTPPAPTATPTASATVSTMPTGTASVTPTATASTAPTSTATPKPTATPTATPTAAPTPSPTPTPTSAPTPALLDPNGLYVLGNGAQPDAAALASRYADGVTLFFGWNSLEVLPGNFNWKTFDASVAQAYLAGKKVAIVDAAGSAAPSWLYTMFGVAQFQSLESDPYSSAWCKTVAIPVPWDSAYLARVQSFVAAFGAHVSSTAVTPSGSPPVYESSVVSRIIIDGVNYTTGETDLPHTSSSPAPVPTKSGQTCPSETTDDLPLWQNDGYTETRVLGAFETIANAYSAAFPRSFVSLTIYLNDNPPIDANGNVIYAHGTVPAQYNPAFAPDLANYGLGRSTILRHYSVQNNGLSAVSSDPDLPFIGGYANQVTTGYQMTWYVTGDPTCRMNGKVGPCDTTAEQATILQNAFTNGLNERAHFIEVYNQDFDNPQLSSVIQNAYAALPH